MLRNDNIICISSIDWDFIWQGHQEIMSTFARNGNRVLFIENTGVRPPRLRDISRIKNRVKNWFRGVKGIRKEMDNLYVFSPLVLPFPYSRIARWINRYLILRILNKWMKTVGFSNPIVWTFLATPLSLDITDNLIKKIVIYYCIDDFSVSSVSARKIRKSEIRLLKKVDLVFVTSKALYNYCSRYSDKVYIFPFAVNFRQFEKVRLKKDFALDEFQNIKGPIIGYVGGVHKWIDQNLIKEEAEKYFECSFVFVGPLQTDISLLSEVGNIHFLGQKEHSELPSYIKAFDVCVIPYLVTDYTKNVYPTKLNEYLAMGNPVVSSYLPEIEAFNEKYGNIVYVGKNAEEFSECIKLAIKEDNDGLRKRRIEVAEENSWENRIEQMSSIIEAEAERKKLDREDRWRENFLSFYRATRRRLIWAGLICFLTYSAIFYTPLAWFLAEPLKIVDIPQHSDVIVVFAGGVGESGKARQGYEERVQYAVELYKKGYARHMIFSSGFMYAFKEPLVMKALAVSLGVPEDAILLEDEAKSTYENVKFTKNILSDKDWDEILLVSSPYHMRRVLLVAKKIAPEIKIIYTPVPKSRFYSHGIGSNGEKVWKQVNLRQIRALIHEYLGIVYYWFKKYI